MFQTEERVSAKALGQEGLDVLVGGTRPECSGECIAWDGIVNRKYSKNINILNNAWGYNH